MQIEIILPSIVLGIMLFFSFAVAPIIFKVLKENDARKFVRTIFPYYYSINLILVSLVCIFLFYKDFINFDFYLLLSIAILFAISLFVLMPMINNARDQKKESKFKYLHAASVIINFLQIFILLYVLL